MVTFEVDFFFTNLLHGIDSFIDVTKINSSHELIKNIMQCIIFLISVCPQEINRVRKNHHQIG